MFKLYKTSSQAAQTTLLSKSQLQDYLETRIHCLKLASAASKERQEESKLKQKPESEYDGLTVEMFESKLAFYLLLLASEQSVISLEVEQKLHDYEIMVNRLYKDTDTCSYFMLIALEQEFAIAVAAENPSKQRKLKSAIKICEMKIALLNLDIKIIQIQITKSLQIAWFSEPEAAIQLAQIKKRQFIEYDTLDFRYWEKEFKFSFDSNKIFAGITDGNRLLELEDFLGRLIVLEPLDKNSDLIIEILANLTNRRCKWEDDNKTVAKLSDRRLSM